MAIIDNPKQRYIAGYSYGYFGSKVIVLSGELLATTSFNKKTSVVALPQLANTPDPINLLQTRGRSFQSSSVKHLTRAELHADDSILAIMALNPATGQRQNFSVSFDSNDQRQQYLQRLISTFPGAQQTYISTLSVARNRGY